MGDFITSKAHLKDNKTLYERTSRHKYLMKRQERDEKKREEEYSY